MDIRLDLTLCSINSLGECFWGNRMVLWVVGIVAATVLSFLLERHWNWGKIKEKVNEMLVNGRTYLLMGITLFLISIIIEEESPSSHAEGIFKILKHVPELFREFGIFFMIAGLVGIVIETNNAKHHLIELLYYRSDFLNNLSQAKKEEFLKHTLRKIYKFASYGVEDDFAELAVESYLPVFREEYKKNFFVHRHYRGQRNDQGDIYGFSVREKKGWRVHYAQDKNEPTKINRTFWYKNEEFLYKILGEFEYNLRQEVAVDGGDTDFRLYEHLKIARKSDFKVAPSNIDEGFELKYKNEGGAFGEFKFVKDTEKKGLEFYVLINDKEKCRIVVDPIGKRVKISFSISPLDLRANTDYHFIEESRFFAEKDEPFSFILNVPTKNVILDILFEEIDGYSVRFCDIGKYSFHSKNAMEEEISSKTHFHAKYSGWFFKGHGVSFSYKLEKSGEVEMSRRKS